MNVPAPQNCFLFYEKNSFYRGFIKLVLTKCCEVFNVTLSSFNNETLFSGGLAIPNGCSVLPLPGDVQREQR